jgi:hypothetical protein
LTKKGILECPTLPHFTRGRHVEKIDESDGLLRVSTNLATPVKKQAKKMKMTTGNLCGLKSPIESKTLSTF